MSAVDVPPPTDPRVEAVARAIHHHETVRSSDAAGDAWEWYIELAKSALAALDTGGPSPHDAIREALDEIGASDEVKAAAERAITQRAGGSENALAEAQKLYDALEFVLDELSIYQYHGPVEKRAIETGWAALADYDATRGVATTETSNDG